MRNFQMLSMFSMISQFSVISRSWPLSSRPTWVLASYVKTQQFLWKTPWLKNIPTLMCACFKNQIDQVEKSCSKTLFSSFISVHFAYTLIYCVGHEQKQVLGLSFFFTVLWTRVTFISSTRSRIGSSRIFLRTTRLWTTMLPKSTSGNLSTTIFLQSANCQHVGPWCK